MRPVKLATASYLHHWSGTPVTLELVGDMP